ncbi:helix-turn-helix domain-containing protein [Treponema pectinovorum]|uniref:helix-turn-helix domain-containing protein n=1 Tax=Treponema pectinovorum TaxID=164 RepID=UPI0011C7E7F4|nr:helix-turn-helix transcriptional regulator [Treponema pectinovorum]
MDQQKIGRFIASCRREQKISQAELSEKLGITDRAVSKWENGKCLPDASLMLELCNLLKISATDLLTGERLNAMENFKDVNDEKLLELQKVEESANRRMLSLEIVIGFISMASFIALVVCASTIDVSTWIRILLIAIACVILFFGIYHCLKLETEVGFYECQDCGYRYVPKMKNVIFTTHVGRSRRLKCPKCANKNFHKKVLTR